MQLENINYNLTTPLCSIMGKNKSDKGNINQELTNHNYSILYYNLFKKLKNKNIRLFELGLGTNNVNLPSNMGASGRPGASHYGWAEFFPNADIFGADIDKDILFKTDRIKTFYCDQTNSNIIKNMWKEKELQENFDIIIEDGLHEFHANVTFFENSIHKLKKNGYYIMEDLINPHYNFPKQIKKWQEKYPDLLFELVYLPKEKNQGDNNVLIIYKK